MKYSHALWLPPHPMTDERWVVLLKYASAMSVAPLNEMFTVVWKLVIIIVCEFCAIFCIFAAMALLRFVVNL